MLLQIFVCYILCVNFSLCYQIRHELNVTIFYQPILSEDFIYSQLRPAKPFLLGYCDLHLIPVVENRGLGQTWAARPQNGENCQSLTCTINKIHICATQLLYSNIENLIDFMSYINAHASMIYHQENLIVTRAYIAANITMIPRNYLTNCVTNFYNWNTFENPSYIVMNIKPLTEGPKIILSNEKRKIYNCFRWENRTLIRQIEQLQTQRNVPNMKEYIRTNAFYHCHNYNFIQGGDFSALLINTLLSMNVNMLE